MNALSPSVNQIEILSPLKPDDLVITSHSIDGTFEVCARRFEFLHVYRMLPEYESDKYAADVGTALHEAVQAWQRAKLAGRENPESHGIFELLRFWPWEVEERRRIEKKQMGNRRLGTAIALYEEIISHEFWDEWEIAFVEGFGPAIEVPWRIVHKSNGPMLKPDGSLAWLATQGKIDFIVRHKRTGKYMVIDLKTTEKAHRAHKAAFRFNNQGGSYGMVLGHALGLPWQTEGITVCYIIAMFPTDEEPMVVYPLMCELPPDEVEDSIKIKIERIETMIKYSREQHYPRRSHGCEFFGTPCGFLSVCHRRDQNFLLQWFEFDLDVGIMKKNNRIYSPIWTLEA